MKSIKYIGYYDDESGKRNIPMAGFNKMKYVARCLTQNGINVEIISAAMPKVGEKVSGKKVQVNDRLSIKTFDCYLRNRKYKRFFDRKKFQRKMYKYLYENVTEGETIIVYHSLAYYKLIKKLKNKKKLNVVVEAEEIYTDVSKIVGVSSQQEMNYLKQADKYIFPTQLLNEKINTRNKPFIIAHGAYTIEEKKAIRYSDGKIHIVYAGTFDATKGGAITAIQAAQFLTSDYHLHIIGFGTREEIENIKKEIAKSSRNGSCTISYDGLKKGEEYIDFLQKCDIGLSTQNPELEFNASSFPSKLLSYMGNGLQIVSVRIPVVERSAIGPYVYYYEHQNPKEIAETICNINIHKECNSYEIMKKLDCEFQKDLLDLLKR